MTYNVFGGTLSLTQSINQTDRCAVTVYPGHLSRVLIARNAWIS